MHEQYCKSRTEVTILKEKNKSLEDVHEEFKSERQAYIPVSVHTASVNECKKSVKLNFSSSCDLDTF